MDLISLYYFQELSKDLNMTKTAQRRISPSRPSATISSAWSSTMAPRCCTENLPSRSPARGNLSWDLPRWWKRKNET